MRRCVLFVAATLAVATLVTQLVYSPLGAQDKAKKDKDKEPDKPKTELKIRRSTQSFTKIDEKAIPAEQKKDRQVYTVYVINKSNWTITGVKSGTTPWIKLPQPIGRTCSLTTCDDSFNAAKFLPLFSTNCSDAPYDLYVMVEHPNGKIAQAGPARINPDCAYLGETVCLELPD